MMPMWWWVAFGFFTIVAWTCAVVAVWMCTVLFFQWRESRRARREDRRICKQLGVRL